MLSFWPARPFPSVCLLTCMQWGQSPLTMLSGSPQVLVAAIESLWKATGTLPGVQQPLGLPGGARIGPSPSWTHREGPQPRPHSLGRPGYMPEDQRQRPAQGLSQVSQWPGWPLLLQEAYRRVVSLCALGVRAGSGGVLWAMGQAQQSGPTNTPLAPGPAWGISYRPGACAHSSDQHRESQCPVWVWACQQQTKLSCRV